MFNLTKEDVKFVRKSFRKLLKILRNRQFKKRYFVKEHADESGYAIYILTEYGKFLELFRVAIKSSGGVYAESTTKFHGNYVSYESYSISNTAIYKKQAYKKLEEYFRRALVVGENHPQAVHKKGLTKKITKIR